MSETDIELLRRIERLIAEFKERVDDAVGTPAEAALTYGLRSLAALANMVMLDMEVFCVEPWHALRRDVPLPVPGEMLLRLKDYKGRPLTPYSAIMAFYEHGYTAQIDTILFLAAMNQLGKSEEKQVSINVSSRSLRDPDFVRTALDRVEQMGPDTGQRIIIEIHESAPTVSMVRRVLELFHDAGISFAIDDVGLSMDDVIRLSEFGGVADYVKIDRNTVCAEPGAPGGLEEVMAFIRSALPGTAVVAEGVRTAGQALEIHRNFPEIAYVQGMYLPDRGHFKAMWDEAAAGR
jgi:EAL domain-containing protein (putative c-di-GMP-specific phosphodiesterase class I)